MTTLTSLRDIVHAQTQTQVAELPDAVIDTYLQQAFERTINAETWWPFYETTWPLVLTAGQYQLALPGDCNVPGIMTLFDVERGLRMEQTAQVWAEDHFRERPTFNGVDWVSDAAPISPQVWYSVWGDMITLWPINVSSVDRNFSLRGYRKPLTWLTGGSEPDCDPRLHLALTHYAVALAYAREEDEVLETSYMDRWMRDVELARRAIMDPAHHRPMAMAGSIDTIHPGGNAWVLVPPS